MIVAGSLLALIAVGAVVLGAYGLWLHTTQRSDGYVMTSSERFSTGGYALATSTLHISSDVPGFLYGRDWLGDVRIRGRERESGAAALHRDRPQAGRRPLPSRRGALGGRGRQCEPVWDELPAELCASTLASP